MNFDPSQDLDGHQRRHGDGHAAAAREHVRHAAGTVIAHALRRAISAAEAAIITSGDVHKNVPSGGQYAAAAVVLALAGRRAAHRTPAGRRDSRRPAANIGRFSK